MLSRQAITKQAVAYGAIALALLPSLQQSHAICHFAGCAADSAATRMAHDVTSPTAAAYQHCCGGKPERTRALPSQDHQDSVPCGPDCLCAQAPLPYRAPRSAAESAASRIAALHAASLQDAGTLCNERSAALVSLDLDGHPPLSAGETCVRLCRFLT